ncbi:MAG TPA: glutathionylspermidine synthase family protein, partial [Gammaproteobacteria bacterium]
LFPNHPYLLNSRFSITDELRERGYVTKPIAGRCGSNISLYDQNNVLVKETPGKFENQNQIYQDLFGLPRIGGHNVQVCTFPVNGSYAGACVRIDPSPVVTSRSDLISLRVVEDKDIL